jgi:heme/copper-type cytochrome/quinol oxidase subunit 3
MLLNQPLAALPAWMGGGLSKFITGVLTLAILITAAAWLYSNISKLREAKQKDEKMDALTWCFISGVVVVFMFGVLSYLGVQAFDTTALPNALPS